MLDEGAAGGFSGAGSGRAASGAGASLAGVVVSAALVGLCRFMVVAGCSVKASEDDAAAVEDETEPCESADVAAITDANGCKKKNAISMVIAPFFVATRTSFGFGNASRKE